METFEKQDDINFITPYDSSYSSLEDQTIADYSDDTYNDMDNVNSGNMNIMIIVVVVCAIFGIALRNFCW